MKKIIKFLKITSHIWALLFIVVAFFIGVSSFNFYTQTDDFVKWLSPDESSNYVFTKLYGQTGELKIYEKYNPLVDEVMHPRSMRSDGGKIKPVSFLGIILIYGTFVKYTTFKLIPYLTPLFASFGLIFYYLFVRRFFGKENALISTILLSVFPVYTYYSARSMFHNVLFVVLLLIGLYFSVLMVGPRSQQVKKVSKVKKFLNFFDKIFLWTKLPRWCSSGMTKEDGGELTDITEEKIPASAGMTMGEAGMTMGEAGMTMGEAGMTREEAGMTREEAGMTSGEGGMTNEDKRGSSIYWTERFARLPKRKDFLEFLFSALGGLFVGLAVITRTSELIWVGPLFFIIWLFNIKKVGITRGLIFLSFLVLGLLPAMHNNQILYGAPIYGGYAEMNQSISNIGEASQDLIKSTLKGQSEARKETFTKIKDSIFYFGIQPKQSLKRLYYYYPVMFPLIFSFSFLGFFVFAYKGLKDKRKDYFVYTFALLVLSVILIFYYGSWGFNDNPDPNAYTIGNSYTRYWLPIYMGMIPWVSFFLIEFLKLKVFKVHKVARSFSVFFVFLIVLLISFRSVDFVLRGSSEGLEFVSRKQIEAKIEAKKVLELTEGNSVIITEYHDKLFFPERKVVVGLFDDRAMISRYKKLIQYLPVYYYNFTLRNEDLDYLNAKRLGEQGVGIKKVEDITDSFTLYKLENRELPTIEIPAFPPAPTIRWASDGERRE